MCSAARQSSIPFHLKAFQQLVGQLLQDVQERLIFRSHVYIRSDIAEYKPHPGDLSYPEKLEMMESIQESLNKEESKRRMSTSSSVSVSSMEVIFHVNTHDTRGIARYWGNMMGDMIAGFRFSASILGENTAWANQYLGNSRTIKTRSFYTFLLRAKFKITL